MKRPVFAFKEAFVDQLQAMIADNLGNYVQKTETWVARFADRSSLNLPTPYVFEHRVVLKHDRTKPKSEQDFHNAKKIHQALRLRRADAADPRLWTRLTHVDFWKYMRNRWPVKGGQFERVRSRYFVSGTGSRGLVRNGVARLWWFAELTHDPARPDPYELTKVLLANQDLAAQLLERNYGRSPHVMRTFLGFLKHNEDVLLTGGDLNRQRLRDLAMHLNNVGGVTVLDLLSAETIWEILHKKLQHLREEEERVARTRTA